MKTYKASVNSQKEYAVTQKDFDIARLDNPNLFQDGRYYGVCPYCNSPVKLIGLTHEIKVSPYAQHTEGDVASIAKKTRKKDYGIVENMYYSFTFHNRFIDDNDEYKETIYAVLTRSKHFDNPHEDGYTELIKNKITINHQELHNKICYYNEHNLRDKKLLEAINKIMEDKKISSL